MKPLLISAAALVVASFGLAPVLAQPNANASDQAASAARKDEQAAHAARDRAASYSRQAAGHAKTAISANADLQRQVISARASEHKRLASERARRREHAISVAANNREARIARRTDAEKRALDAQQR